MKKYSIIAREVRRTNINYMIVFGIVLLFAVRTFFVHGEGLYNYFGGPFPADEAVIASWDKVDFHEVLREQEQEAAMEALENLTEEERIERETAREIEAFYAYNFPLLFGATERVMRVGRNQFLVSLEEREVAYEFPAYATRRDHRFFRFVLLPVGDGYLVTEITPYRLETNQFDGVMIPMHEILQRDLAHHVPEAYFDQIYNVVFYATRTFQNQFFSTLIYLLIILLLVGFLAFRFVRRLINPMRHPIYKKLLMFGDPQKTAAQIDEEFMMKEAKVYRKEAVTKTFRIRKRLFSLDISKNASLDPWDGISMKRLNQEEDANAVIGIGKLKKKRHVNQEEHADKSYEKHVAKKSFNRVNQESEDEK